VLNARSGASGAIFAALFALCGGCSGSSESSSVERPNGLTYATNPAAYTKGTAITPNVPTSGGGAVASYSVSPALPAGLSLNASTGVISGTPTAVTAAADYAVTANNSGGNATVSLSISVGTNLIMNGSFESPPFQ
jgi:hypothetical protein